MGAGAEDALRAFHAFDFDANNAWKRYVASLEIPAGTTSYSSILRKRKARWFKENVNADLDVDAACGSDPVFQGPRDAHAAPAAGTRPPPVWAGSGDAAPRSSPSSGGTASAGPSTASASASGGVAGWARKALNVVLNGLVIGLTVATLLPFLPGLLSARLYWLALVAVAVVSATRVGRRVGLPPRLNLQALKDWLMQAMAIYDMYHFLLALVFVVMARQVQSMTFLLAPAILAYFQLMANLRSLMGLGLFSRTPLARLYDATSPRRQQAMNLMASIEVAGAFLLAVQVVLKRNLQYALATYMYLNVLRLMYHAPESAGLHRKAWSDLWTRFGASLVRIPGAMIVVNLFWRWITMGR